jgi:hypothetical protein
MVVLTLKAKNDHLQKVASTRDHIKALGELVWNALDADATEVDVDFELNSLGGLQAIVISDNGTGISKERAEHDFESLGDSWKRTTQRTSVFGRAIHGKEGQGRLRFYSLAQRAIWRSVYRKLNALGSLIIEIDAASLQTSTITELPDPDPNTRIGTIVTLAPLKESFGWLTSDDAKYEFTATFAPYVLQYPKIIIRYNGETLNPNSAIFRQYNFVTKPIICKNHTERNLSLKIIEWRAKVESRKIYFGSENGVVLGSQAANIAAPDFHFTVYAYSPYFQEIADANLLEIEGLTDVDFSNILDYIRDNISDYFRIRQAERSGELIQSLIDAGVYPYEGEPRDEIETREREVFDIATHAVSSYSKDFRKADNSIKKMTLGLLKVALAHNPESVSRIMKAVFNLPKYRQDEFSGLLERSELGNIIAASSLITDRIVSLQVLKEMVFEPKRRSTIKERGELDVLVRDNTWIFGENFHLTMAESGLTKIMRRVSEDLSLKRASATRGRKPDGKIGRIDTFMGRLVPHPNPNHREYFLIELKRPSLKIGRKELDQLEDYVSALTKQPDFINTSTQWHFFLVTGEYDKVVADRITQKDRPVGLFLDKPNHKVWVKNWSEIIRDCDARLNFIEKTLRIEISAAEITERIAQLKSSILKSEEEQIAEISATLGAPSAAMSLVVQADGRASLKTNAEFRDQ